MLEMAGIPYTGAGVLGSAMAMDKLLAKQMMVGAGIPTPRFRKIELGRWRRSPQAICIQIADVIGFPCVLKQPQMGSSTGMGMVSDIAQLQILADRLFESAEVLLAESYMGGRELTCGVLARVGDGGLQVLPVTEIKPRSADFFDYDAKYLPGACEEITPAPLAEHQRVRVQATALRVHKLLRCGPLSRTDMILGHDGATYVLEANTLPGMTPTSLVPQAARVAGISFAQLLERLIALALEDAPPKVGVPRWATRRLQREGKAAAGQ
jgi:D-alanine-D-alanine ligase